MSEESGTKDAISMPQNVHTIVDHYRIERLESQLALYRGKAHRRRQEIKRLLRHNDLLRQCWHKEIALARENRMNYSEEGKKLFRFAKFAYRKFFPESHLAEGTTGYTFAVSKWLHQWENEIDERPK